MERLGLNGALSKTCKNLKIHEPTEIQEKTIPPILKGLDLIGVAQTGSGKTACYCLPSLQKLAADPYGVFGIVLLPTKELAAQVFEQFAVFSTSLGFRDKIALVVGGDPWLVQTRKIADRPYIVVATPWTSSRTLGTSRHTPEFFKSLCYHFRRGRSIAHRNTPS
ncbi:uncharacterized protein LOC129617881 [Condylostylus longicornis]|uniref:uncharacterized protein LOC129617881 n=1 Tax=Condylostylus longicornis TaxID=2530218 RepID=UPI00244E198A|nr:uncharacterized protein LOC129617881 [Condylostylus longicornis]